MRLYDEIGDEEKQELLRFAIMLKRRGQSGTSS